MVPGAAARRFEVDVQPLKDASGVVGLAVLSTELTDRRVRKQGPAGIENRLRALTEHARDVITVAGRDGRLQYVSGGHPQPRWATTSRSVARIRCSSICMRTMWHRSKPNSRSWWRGRSTAFRSSSAYGTRTVRIAGSSPTTCRRSIIAGEGRGHQFAGHHGAQAGGEPAGAAEEVFRLARGCRERHHFRVGPGGGDRASIARRARGSGHRGRRACGGGCVVGADPSAGHARL